MIDAEQGATHAIATAMARASAAANGDTDLPDKGRHRELEEEKSGGQQQHGGRRPGGGRDGAAGSEGSRGAGEEHGTAARRQQTKQ